MEQAVKKLGFFLFWVKNDNKVIKYAQHNTSPPSESILCLIIKQCCSLSASLPEGGLWEQNSRIPYIWALQHGNAIYSCVSPQPHWNGILSKESLKSEVWVEETVAFLVFWNRYKMINSHNEINLPLQSTTHCGKAT